MSKIQRLIIIEKLNDVSLVITSDEDVRRDLGEHFTFEVPGYKFMPAYRNKHWDGKIRLFSYTNGQIYAGLHPYKANSGTGRGPQHNRLAGKKREATYSHRPRPRPNLDSNDKQPFHLERKAHVPSHAFRQKGSCRPVERSRYSHACHGVNRPDQRISWLPSAHQYRAWRSGQQRHRL